MKFLLFALVLFVQTVSAFPLKPDGITLNLKLNPLSFFDEDQLAAAYNFDGIVSLSNCSGSLVRFTHSRDTDLAMVLTNGHCLGDFPEPGTAVVNRAERRSFSIMGPTGQTVGRVNSTKILYGTMTKTDMALYVLDKTHQQIQSEFRAKSLTLASDYSRINDSIEVISGYWRRGYSCKVEAQVYSLKESRWTFFDSVRYSRPGCETIGGTSGSPVVLAGTRTVVAVNNTGNDDGDRCTMNNPCEVDERGQVTAQQGYSYAQQTSWIYTCLDSAGNLNLNQAGCKLAK